MIRSFGGKTPRIADSAFVSEAAYILGDVRIGEESGVWPGAVVRADFATITIGSRTMIEDNCVLHSGEQMEIGDHVIVGHGAIVHGRKIGNHVLIGNNATILDGAVVGDHCIIGANCLVAQGMVVADGFLVVGVPAVVKGEVTARQRENLAAGLRSYVELVARYRRHSL